MSDTICRQLSLAFPCIHRQQNMAPDNTHVKSRFKKNKKFIPKQFKRKNKKGISEEIEKLEAQYKDIDTNSIHVFENFPLSKNTIKGLTECGYVRPTEIQRDSIGFGLQGQDILGAAETGSGKTLAFLVPVLEVLHCRQWTHMDGLGALIITPTRELAYQIFETLKKVGKYHNFSAGLIIGGKDLHFEKDRMDQCNIIICTPGRILHHMDVNPLFSCHNLELLVLDEADRCLDMGFEQTMNHIIENLPPKRQTLLFSATQTKSVKDLARLSLKSPKYVSVHETKQYSTPDGLEQSYVVCDLHDKINLVWSFIKNHKRQKILIFLSTCKQVKYLYLLFCRLRPGTPLLALYGSLHQLRRMNVYNEFCSKQNVVMFATDIAARGLDFPEVNWVLQLDCPEDANTYIHRAGRTARYQRGGESLLVLQSAEEKGMVEELQAKRIPIVSIQVNPSKLMSPLRKMEALLARDPNLKADAQRAFVSYVKWVYLMKNKNVFNVDSLNLDRFAASLGLAVTPRVRFLKGRKTDNGGEELDKLRKIAITESSDSTSQSDNAASDRAETTHTNVTFRNILSKESDDDRDLLTLKRRDHDIEGEPLPPLEDNQSSKNKKSLTKAALVKKMLKKKIVANRKTVFDEEGEEIANKGKNKFSEEAKNYEMEDEPGIDIEKAKLVLKAEDKFDKKLFKDRIKEKHKEKKRKLKKEKTGEDEEVDEDVDVRLGSESDGDGSEPDVSWLPDPDKVYGKKQGRHDTQDTHMMSSSDSVKRKMSSDKRAKKAKREERFDTGLTLAEDEELALRILQGFS